MSATAQSPMTQPALRAFSGPVREWFESRFERGPTEAQARGWLPIMQGRDTLIAAPTGSGKTLAAFLVHIDRLYREAAEGRPAPGAVDVVYVSPLKALVSDIAENLELPLREIRTIAERRGDPVPPIEVAMRTGDSPSSQRAALVKRPPQILVTTPESLYLMLTAEKSRALLGQVRSVIVDEIHALARDKRGVHMALSLQRLEALNAHRPARTGLSATQRPLEQIARLLVGAGRLDAAGSIDCCIVDEGHRRALDLELELPNRELEAVASTEQLAELMDQVAAHVQQHRTTLVFVNTRRLSERLAHLLSERLGEGQVAAHHGSLSKERRLRVEQRLRAGELRVLVATASLELGIDIGPVELVCQIGSPRSIATLLQRVGRSGHTRFATPKGRLFPLTRDELVECTALLSAVQAGELDRVILPRAPLDILAQQIVAECAAESWSEQELFELFTRAAPYAGLPREVFDELLDVLSQGIDTGRGKRAAYLHRDRVGGRVSGRRGARLSALTSGGAIPDVADYRVIEEPSETFVGTINEDFAIESMAGDVFMLGSTSWRIRRVTRGQVRVVNAEGATATLPFWLGEAPARTFELSSAVSELRRDVEARLTGDSPEGAVNLVRERAGLSDAVARTVVDYLSASREALGLLPTQRDLVFERFFDESGGMQLVVHCPYGGRINRGLGLLLRKRFCRSFDFELQAAANDDSIVLSLGEQHSFPLEDLRDFLSPKGVRQALIHAVLVTPMFQSRWRWNLNRALIVLRFRGGKKNPPQFQRMEADDVMAAVFPSLAACQDNATGPREIPDHFIVRQTLDDCLTEAMDHEGLVDLLERIEAGAVRVHFRDTTEPSPLSHEILTGRPYTFLDDAPLEERRTQAVQLRRGLPLEARDLSALDPAAIERVRAEAAAAPRSAEELHDLLYEFVLLRPVSDWQPWFEELQRAGRAARVRRTDGEFWFCAERRAAVAALVPDGRLGPTAPVAALESERADAQNPEQLAAQLIRATLDVVGPITQQALAEHIGLQASLIGGALSQLEADGFALRGHFDPQLPSGQQQYCSRRLLSRIHGYTQARLRREIEPVSAQDYLRFLLDFHGVTSGQRRRGPGGLLQCIEQLQGFEAAADSWESELLKVRLSDFSADDLDTLCWSGDVVWGRLSLRAAMSDQAWANFCRFTPITLAVRDDFSWLLHAVRGPADGQPQTTAVATPSPQAEVAQVTEVLGQRGALFFAELLSATGLSNADLEEALWDNVARGLVTSDGFSALRGLLRARDSQRPRLVQYARRGLRRGARRVRSREGRWALLDTGLHAGDLRPATDELAEAVAEQLLARYGVVFRDVVTRESFNVPWRDVLWALRRLEARGLVRGGRFVGGFVGEQFALPEAVEALRQIRRTGPDGQLVRVSGCDPLNLVGIIVPGPRVPAQRGAEVIYRDGQFVPQPDPAQSSTDDVARTSDDRRWA